MIVAVDGPSASGKGTLARRLAQTLDLAYLDTGQIYRAVAARLMAAGQDPADPELASAAARALTAEDLDRPNLRDEELSQAASIVAAIPSVRTALLGFQRSFAERPPGGARGAILDGRDIGTVVCPDAEVKLFITAAPEERARRRHRELLSRGEQAEYETILVDIRRRDERDMNRSTAPLKAAADAITLDTTHLDADGAFQAALDLVERKRTSK
jgi:cytidylate kinase